MIILPGHHSERSRLATQDDTNKPSADPAEVEPQADAGPVATILNGNPQSGHTPDPLHTTVPIPKLNEIASGGGEEYGAELGKDARFWKTYVKEADQWDAELVDGWSKSLDVILILVKAALFSAISTAFVIESAKGLQQDPAESSARSLLLISQTLLAMSSSNQQASPVPALMDDNDFTPSASTVCVNVLWFLSLSLSVAVSLVAMLAKEWCYSYMSGRIGHHCGEFRPSQEARRACLMGLPVDIPVAAL
ncbi:hypothetical protein BDV93DRAFT_512473 [Ceratobasidium sp. AG-I]|nr:hypothetical protein BDV93DRAFT_512473 [Ceratobasidium sp. AG-I]